MPRRLALSLVLTLCLVPLLALSARTAGAGTLYDRAMSQLGPRLAAADPRDYTFVVLGDSQGDERIFGGILRKIAQIQPLFVLHLGGFTKSGHRGELDAFVGFVTGTIPDIPVFCAKGPHETIVPEALDDYFEVIGPSSYTLELPPLAARVAVLDNSRYSLSEEALGDLSRDLSRPAATRFAAMHIPPQTARWSTEIFQVGAPRLLDILNKNRTSAAFFGHPNTYDADTSGFPPLYITGGAGGPLAVGLPFGQAAHHFLAVRVVDGAPRVVRIDWP